MNHPLVAISVLHYRNLDETIKCLRSVHNLSYPGFKIFVVNNDTKEHAAVIQKEFGESITLIQSEGNVGFAEGQNVAIRAALADLSVEGIVVLNNDTTVEPSLLMELVSTQADMVAPRIMQMDQPTSVDSLGIMVTSTGLPFNRTSEEQPLFCPTGGCAFYTRRLLEQSSLDESGRRVFFDPAYFAYAEDFDLGWRARNAGFAAAYARNAVVFHKGSAATGKLSEFAVYHTYRNLIWTQYKNLKTSVLLERLPWLLVGWLTLLVYYLRRGTPGILLRAIRDGLKGVSLMSAKRKASLEMIQVPRSQIRSMFAGELIPKVVPGKAEP